MMNGMKPRLAVSILTILMLSLTVARTGAWAQETNETRLRDAVRQAVMEMRAAQDQAAQAQSDLAKAQTDKQALQTQLDAATANLAEHASSPATPKADLDAIQKEVRAGQAQNAALQQSNSRLQTSYQQAAALARQKDELMRDEQMKMKAQMEGLQTCKATNGRLIDLAEQVLHLYESQSFRSILLRSYEPFIGTAKVKLENMVQDYDDKIREQEYTAKPH